MKGRRRIGRFSAVSSRAKRLCLLPALRASRWTGILKSYRSQSVRCHHKNPQGYRQVPTSIVARRATPTAILNRPANKAGQPPRHRHIIIRDCAVVAVAKPDMGGGKWEGLLLSACVSHHNPTGEMPPAPETATLTLSRSTAGSGVAETGFAIESTEACLHTSLRPRVELCV